MLLSMLSLEFLKEFGLVEWELLRLLVEQKDLYKVLEEKLLEVLLAWRLVSNLTSMVDVLEHTID